MSSLANCVSPCDVRPPASFLKNRALLATFAATFGGMSGFYLLFSVVPLYAVAGGASEIGAGLVTGLLMLATVGVELVMPRLTRSIGYRRLFAFGLFLLGAPALLLPFTHNMVAILAVSLVRGMGLAIVVTAGPPLAAALVPAERRGETLGLYGAVSNMSAILALPLGVWLANAFGYIPVFIAGAVMALAGIAATWAFPSRTDAPDAALGILAGLQSPALMRPAAIFFTVAMAAGIITTFLPIVFGEDASRFAALALLAQAVAATAARWLAGRYGDRHGVRNLVIPSLLAAGFGVATLVLADQPVLVMIGMLAFGAGFGGLQNASLSLMFARVEKSGYDTASAVWNLSYDAAYGVGAVAFGVLAVTTGYPTAFALTAAIIMAAIVPALYDRKG
jgi:predicted MFS family arabinose efflux permease